MKQIVKKNHWGRNNQAQVAWYYARGYFQRAQRRTGPVTLAISLMLASMSLVYAPEPRNIETRYEIRDTIWVDGKAQYRDTVIIIKYNPVATAKIPENEAAPVSAKEVFSGDVNEYVERFDDIARQEMHKYGIPASISLAQGLIESRAGSSKLAVNNNNHFGIKCFSQSCKKGHCTNFKDDTHKDFFRKFKSPWESWRAHSQLLASGRYTRLKKYGRDYRKWAYGLKSAGYATDRTYAEKLIGIIERYELYKYDR